MLDFKKWSGKRVRVTGNNGEVVTGRVIGFTSAADRDSLYFDAIDIRGDNGYIYGAGEEEIMELITLDDD